MLICSWPISLVPSPCLNFGPIATLFSPAYLRSAHGEFISGDRPTPLRGTWKINGTVGGGFRVQIGKDERNRKCQECSWWEVLSHPVLGHQIYPNLVHWLLGTDADLSRCPTCVANMISSDAYWSYCGFTLVHKVLNITRELRVGFSCSISGLFKFNIKYKTMKFKPIFVCSAGQLSLSH